MFDRYTTDNTLSPIYYKLLANLISKTMDLFGPQLIDQFDKVLETDYKDEAYLVRDNGAVLRKNRKERRRSHLDEVWTFGKKHKSGYMRISEQYVHIIVAHAFHGPPPDEYKRFVNHIDTNKCNNRPDNLQWVTWLENLLRNPLTRRKIINSWGSLEKFFDAPNKFKGLKNNNWMRPISEQEAKYGKEQFIIWAKLESVQTDEYVNEFLASQNHLNHLMEPINTDVKSRSALAVQRNWKNPSEFPNCPDKIGCSPLEDYQMNLSSASVFARDEYKESAVVTSEICDSHLVVVTKSKEENPIKPWAVAKVTIEDGMFVHEAIRTFIEKDGALNELDRLMGRNEDRNSIDDYL